MNSLGLQAVLDRITARAGAGFQRLQSDPLDNPISATLTSIYRKNEYYIKEVVDASRSLLLHVVEGLLPGDILKHAPVRTYMRFLSGATFLLKVNMTAYLHTVLFC